MNVDHENTVRTLKDEPPIATGIWCRFGIHRWTMWSDGQWIRDRDYSSLQNYIQNMNCVHCNKMKTRQVLQTKI